MKRLWDEMRALPECDFSAIRTASTKISLLIPAKSATHCLRATVEKAHGFFEARFPGEFEIILIPTVAGEKPEKTEGETEGESGDAADRTFELAEQLSQEFSNVRCIIHPGPVGKGAALRTGFQASRGSHILFTDADLPYDLGFFEKALGKLDLGYSLVTGNRRLKESTFELPIGLLNLAYRRHRLGMLFNSFARFMLGIETTDTQAGIKAMSRALALSVFARPLCPGFFFDLEIFLTAQGSGKRWLDLPTVLFLGSEKSTVRILRESYLATFWLNRIWSRKLRGVYGGKSQLPWLPRLFSHAPLLTKIRIHLKWALTPYRRISKYLPPKGAILDLGCGHGLLAASLACQDQVPRRVLGVDDNSVLIEQAQKAFGSLGGPKSLVFEKGWFQPFPKERFSGIAIIDGLRKFSSENQTRILRDAAQRLAPGGTLVVRERELQWGLEPPSGSDPETGQNWVEFFYEQGFEVRSEPCGNPVFRETLYVCEKPHHA